MRVARCELRIKKQNTKKDSRLFSRPITQSIKCKYVSINVKKKELFNPFTAILLMAYFNISLNNKTFISDIFFKVASLVINISAFASKEVAI